MATTNATETPELTADGELMIGNSAQLPSAATLTAGSGITILNGAGSITISASGSGSIVEVTGASQSMAVNTTYIAANGGAGVTFTLPSSASAGAYVEVIGFGSGGFSIDQNAGQTIYTYNVATTTGAGGSLTANQQYNAIKIVCVATDTDWVVTEITGDYTIV